MFEDIADEFKKIIDETDDIIPLLVLWKEWKDGDYFLQKQIERLKNKIKIYLKERKWDRYFDKKTNISVSIETIKKENILKDELKFFLSDAQLAQVTKISSFERLSIVTPEQRKRLKKYVRQKKQN